AGTQRAKQRVALVQTEQQMTRRAGRETRSLCFDQRREDFEIVPLDDGNSREVIAKGQSRSWQTEQGAQESQASRVSLDDRLLEGVLIPGGEGPDNVSPASGDENVGCKLIGGRIAGEELAAWPLAAQKRGDVARVLGARQIESERAGRAHSRAAGNGEGRRVI